MDQIERIHERLDQIEQRIGVLESWLNWLKGAWAALAAACAWILGGFRHGR
jgi:hypothetical protein